MDDNQEKYEQSLRNLETHILRGKAKEHFLRMTLRLIGISEESQAILLIQINEFRSKDATRTLEDLIARLKVEPPGEDQNHEQEIHDLRTTLNLVKERFETSQRFLDRYRVMLKEKCDEITALSTELTEVKHAYQRVESETENIKLLSDNEKRNHESAKTAVESLKDCVVRQQSEVVALKNQIARMVFERESLLKETTETRNELKASEQQEGFLQQQVSSLRHDLNRAVTDRDELVQRMQEFKTKQYAENEDWISFVIRDVSESPDSDSSESVLMLVGADELREIILTHLPTSSIQEKNRELTTKYDELNTLFENSQAALLKQINECRDCQKFKNRYSVIKYHREFWDELRAIPQFNYDEFDEKVDELVKASEVDIPF